MIDVRNEQGIYLLITEKLREQLPDITIKHNFIDLIIELNETERHIENMNKKIARIKRKVSATEKQLQKVETEMIAIIASAIAKDN